MQNAAEVVVVRLGHRPGRDDRMTTHVGLTARALGADRFVLVADDTGPLDRIDAVTDRFGGPFETDQADSFGSFCRDWSGMMVHLTMYGLPIQETVDAVRPAVAPDTTGLAIVVGAEKVPFEVYERADHNIAVTNQPHSEIASLAVLLDRIFGNEALERSFVGGTHRVRPQACGKLVEPCDDAGP